MATSSNDAAKSEPDDDKEENVVVVTVSEHTLAMRRALRHCQELLASVVGMTADSQVQEDGPNSVVVQASYISKQQAQRDARSLASWRREALLSFVRRSDEDDVISSSSPSSVTVVDDMSLPLDFKRRFIYSNRPCKIRDARWCRAHFSPVLDAWTTHSSSTCSCGSGRDEIHGTSTAAALINRSWFETRVAAAGGVTLEKEDASARSAMLPVRYAPQTKDHPNEPPAEVDEDGRAMECVTQNMSLSAWFKLLDNASQNEEVGDDDDANMSTLQNIKAGDYYLKDWHLQLWLEQQQQSNQQDIGSHHPSAASSCSLYKVPEHFETDLLNNLLIGFSNGDYRFTYWGPRGSKTGLHSDVLNSFSWSLNIHGIKEWTFYVPEQQPDETDGASTSRSRPTGPPVVLTIQQEPGECIFVPAGWKHRVLNRTEALSINHNWITAANVDLVWECLLQELRAVQDELLAWSSGNATDWSAQESMLRGCVGLDVTAFVIMVLLGLLEAVEQVMPQHRGFDDSNGCWERYFDMTRLSDMMQLIIENRDLHLLERLQACLDDSDLGTVAMQVIRNTLAIVERIFSGY